MSEVKDKQRLSRRGLFGKYVLALVGLVVFVLAVNGALESWISYRATRTTLIDAMSEKAEATSKRIEQSVTDLERDISRVTRASASTIDQHRADYAQLLNDVPAVKQLALLSGQGRELLRLSRTSILVSGGADFSRDLRFSETMTKGVDYAPATFRASEPYMSISVAQSGFNAGVAIGDIDLHFLSDFLGEAQVGKATFAYVVDSHGRVLATSERGPAIGKDLSQLPQVAAMITPGGQMPSLGTDIEGSSVLTAASPVSRFGWHVFFEQPTAQALAPIRDQLLRVALLIALGLAVAILASTLLARRMLVPITALRAGARRLGAGDFSQRIDVHTADELEELADQFNSMAGQLAETYGVLEAKVEERTRDLAQSVNELKVLEEVGRAVASSLDLNAVLPTVAARALEITNADAVLIYGYDAANRKFNLAEAIGIDRNVEG
jgi:adenylate cyclase